MRWGFAESVSEAAFDEVVDRARKRALDLSAFTTYQQQFHPLPFLSELNRDAFLAVMRLLAVRRLDDGALVMRQGEPGTALYLVAAGEDVARNTASATRGPSGVKRPG